MGSRQTLVNGMKRRSWVRLRCTGVWIAFALVSLALPAMGQREWRELPVLRNQADHAVAYDSARERVVLFGLGQTWEWDGGSWIKRFPATNPPALLGHAMAYDSRRGRVVLFGGEDGEDGSSHFFSDTWEWLGDDWVKRSTTISPSARARHALAYDSARGRTVLFGGSDSSGGPLSSDTWEWDGDTWTERHPDTPRTGFEYHPESVSEAMGRSCTAVTR